MVMQDIWQVGRKRGLQGWYDCGLRDNDVIYHPIGMKVLRLYLLFDS